ncbi:MAG: hypothetical protein JSS86_22075, partial [Cyanobacteria bacterium SZAS LIN-2]|nr:hypothetical protein [Cyanobacteria bacterium SZAS LIN-2]
ISAGEWTLRRTGPNNSEGSFTHQYTDGRQLTRYSDGRTVDSKTAKDGSFKVVGTGPRPHDNYVSEATKNGDLYIKYADQSRGRAYYSHAERKH